MKALLISSFRFDTVTRTDIAPPLNLLYVSAVLRNNGITPRLLDMNLVPVSADSTAEEERLGVIRSKLLEEAPDIVGISCLTTAHFPFMRKAAEMTRRLLPKAKIILGGVHATLFSREILENCKDFDYIIMGEGEEQTAELAKAFLKGDVGDLSHIQSLAWRKPSGEVVVNERRDRKSVV